MLNSSSLGFGEVLRAHHFTVVKLKSNILAASVKCVVQRKINIIYINLNWAFPFFWRTS